MLFDAQAALAEILSDPPKAAIPAISEIRSGRVAEIAEIATLSAKTLDSAEVLTFSRKPSAPNGSRQAALFPHGQCQLTGRPRTWTGRIVNLAEWRELSDWDRNGSTGKIWNGLTRQWEKSSDCNGTD